MVSVFIMYVVYNELGLPHRDYHFHVVSGKAVVVHDLDQRLKPSVGIIVIGVSGNIDGISDLMLFHEVGIQVLRTVVVVAPDKIRILIPPARGHYRFLRIPASLYYGIIYSNMVYRISEHQGTVKVIHVRETEYIELPGFERVFFGIRRIADEYVEVNIEPLHTFYNAF